jgi:hypothetical protein
LHLPPAGAQGRPSWVEVAQLAPIEKLGKIFLKLGLIASFQTLGRFEPINVLKVGGWTPLPELCRVHLFDTRFGSRPWPCMYEKSKTH